VGLPADSTKPVKLVLPQNKNIFGCATRHVIKCGVESSGEICRFVKCNAVV